MTSVFTISLLTRSYRTLIADISGGESISAGEMDYSHMDVVNWNAEGSSLSVPREFFLDFSDFVIV